jgi:UDP-galactopyranose mutase
VPQQSHATLPAILAGWDLCPRPFARSDHTRFITPTKTLDYPPATKGVVSTSSSGTVRSCTSATSDAFIDACHRLLYESAGERDGRVAAARSCFERRGTPPAPRIIDAGIDAPCSRRACPT